MIYVASPYSDPDPGVQHQRYLDVSYAVVQLMQQKIPAYAPIVHCHELALNFNLPGDAEYWQEYNTAFLNKADAVYVVKLPGWDKSKGVRQEIELAWALDIPVRLVGTNGQVFYRLFPGTPLCG